MHNNYFFLQQLSLSLEKTLSSSVVSECFSQNKDELIIRFETEHGPFFIRASLSASFSCLSFPENFHRAKKNSIDLFEALPGQRVEGLRQFENERSFAIQFNNSFFLVFKMHGNRSNIILFKESVVDEVFKNNILGDAQLNLNELNREIDWSYENFIKHSSNPESIYFTFGKVVWKYLKTHGYDTLTPSGQWHLIQNILQKLNNPPYYISEIEGRTTFSLLDIGDPINEFHEPIKAITEFFNAYTQRSAFSTEKLSAVSFLKSKLQASQNYITKTFNKLQELERDDHYKIWADLLMANLNNIPAGADRATLSDFYHNNQLVEIKLKQDLSPQKIAAVFYKKSKNQQIEINYLKQVLETKQRDHEILTSQLKQIETTHDLKNLRRLFEQSDAVQEKKKQSIPLPYREVIFNGYQIWIGKNAQGNDILTLKYGYKDDLWLHAKDVAGSHVLIKHQSGKKIPKEVIERAAQLAAYYSKRKNESLCPVTITTKKYVRKRKGDPPGMVIVEREEVIMVEPKMVSGER